MCPLPRPEPREPRPEPCEAVERPRELARFFWPDRFWPLGRKPPPDDDPPPERDFLERGFRFFPEPPFERDLPEGADADFDFGFDLDFPFDRDPPPERDFPFDAFAPLDGRPDPEDSSERTGWRASRTGAGPSP